MNLTIQTMSRGLQEMAQSNTIQYILFVIFQLLLVCLILFVLYYLIHIGNRYVESKRKLIIERKQILNLFLVLFYIIIGLIILRFRGIIFRILAPFIAAIVVAYILNPLVKFLNEKGIARLWGVLIVYLGIALLILLLSLTLIPKIVSEISELLVVLPEITNNVYEYLHDIYIELSQNLEKLPPELDGVKNLLQFNYGQGQQLVLNLFTGITNTLISLFGKVFNVVLVPILAFYFLKDAEDFKKSIILLIPSGIRRKVLEMAKDFDDVLGGFIRGQLIVATLVGILTVIMLLVLRVEFAILVGLIAGLANVIPYFGPVIGIVPGAFFALMDSPMKAIWVVIGFTVIQQIESAILAPKIVGKSVGIHPIWVILSLVVGGRLFGLLGLLIAVPMAGIIKVLGKHIIAYIVRF